MTFLTLKQRIARRLNKNAASLDTLTSQRLSDFLNESHRELLSESGMQGLREDVLTLATVASTDRYALPEQGIARLNRLWIPATQRTLVRRTLAWLRENDPSPISGTPDSWIPLSYTQVHTQPTAAAEVFVKSTSASDTAQTCYVEGIITGGYRRTASVTLTGTTAVTLSASITFLQVDKCYLSASAVGTVTLHQTSGAGAELSRITIGDTYAKFLSFLLYPTPSAVETVSLDITRGIADMTNDTDEPLLPEDFHDLLLDMATMKELEKTDDVARHRILAERVRKRRSELRYWLFGQASDANDPAPISSNLGPWYPAGVW